MCSASRCWAQQFEWLLSLHCLGSRSRISIRRSWGWGGSSGLWLETLASFCVQVGSKKSNSSACMSACCKATSLSLLPSYLRQQRKLWACYLDVSQQPLSCQQGNFGCSMIASEMESLNQYWYTSLYFSFPVKAQIPYSGLCTKLGSRGSDPKAHQSWSLLKAVCQRRGLRKWWWPPSSQHCTHHVTLGWP